VSQPTLVIGYEGQGIPVTAVCSLCGEYMAEEIFADIGSKATVARFTEQFKVHLQMKHLKNSTTIN
jgi:hypothetical protein